MSWWGSPCYTSSCASPGSCRSRQLAAWDVERSSREGGCCTWQAGENVDRWTRLCRRTCSSSSSSPSPPTLTGPPGRHYTHRTSHGESIKRESFGGVAVTDFVTAVAGGGGATDDRTHGIARPYASSPPARRMATGVAQPLRRR